MMNDKTREAFEFRIPKPHRVYWNDKIQQYEGEDEIADEFADKYHGQWIAWKAACDSQNAESDTQNESRCVGDTKQAGEPVARLLHWKGPKHIDAPSPCARSFNELPYSPEDNHKYWAEGEALYTAPQPQPDRVPVDRSRIERLAHELAEGEPTDWYQAGMDIINDTRPQTPEDV